MSECIDKINALSEFAYISSVSKPDPLGYGDNYKYAHDFEGNFAEQEFMPEGLVGRRFYQPADNPKERELAQRIKTLWKGKY